MEEIADVLAQRYATKPIRDIWSARGKIVLEREFWIAVMRAQRDLGLDIPEEAIEAYERVKNDVDTASINARERVTRHDVKARIEEFCALAGCEHIHKGMTSRDLTESVEQLQVFRSLEHIRLKTVAAIRRLAERAAETRDVAITARTHNVAAQLTTLGKRFAMFGEDLLVAFRELEALIANYPARGVKGAVGTQLDLLTLFDHDLAKVAEFDARVRRHLGIPHAFNATGQVYPRSLDFATVATLVHVGAGASSFAKTLRLMAGHELAGEGFLPGQVGSSAMPHKMNSRSCERLNGLHVILKGYLSMTAALAGDQWNEGDVSCSVVRRVALPDSFFAIDALLETFLVILNQMEINVPVIEREKNHYLPFLLTTTIMMEAVKRGVGRETAHEVIKEHAVAASRDLRQGKISRNDLFDRLAADGRLKLSRADFDAIAAAASAETGTAGMQTDAFVAAARELSAKYPAAAEIRPGAIL
ncbi:MAG TPA: adenylosuccinate lyase [Candidatus Spyradosoma merdigallinarum]|uniref:Adenylosuccinate lyase n=1 Tax=Candidatus Spyradosoma merdigallinarum TaxID=2840950 RepID=A0A9D1NJB6_9BACT|nr:adenylosuccinate lyase [Candidatus Spyradosoma merdigallinarum]